MSAPLLEMTVAGLPETKGSYIGLGGGRVKADNPREKAWAQLIGWAAKAKMRGGAPSSARVRVDVRFRLPPPHGKKNRRDLDKMLRSALDALSRLVYADDEQIDMITAEKVVTADNHGVTLTVAEHRPYTLARLFDFVRMFADEPCEYGDRCVPNPAHGTCRNCQAKDALGEPR